MTDYPGRQRVGEGIADPARRARWLALVDAAHEAHLASGGSLVFHGTTAAVGEAIRDHGLTTTEVVLRDEDGRWGADGTYWASPVVAAFYAEDRMESLEDPDLELALVAVRLEDLEREGEFVQDEMSLECPIESRIGMDVEEIVARYETLVREGVPPWRACFAATASFVCLGPVGPELVHVVTHADELMGIPVPSRPSRSR